MLITGFLSEAAHEWEGFTVPPNQTIGEDYDIDTVGAANITYGMLRDPDGEPILTQTDDGLWFHSATGRYFSDIALVPQGGEA